MVKLTDEEKETLSYDDVAYLILNDEKKKIKIQDLFKKVIKVMGLPESEYEEGIGDFFELITTDKRFIILDKGYCDLKINHSTKVIIDDDDDEEYEMMKEVNMIERLELLKKRYEELNEELLNPEVLSDFSKQMKLSKKKSSIEPSVMKYDELKKVTAEIEDLKSLVNDPEMHEIASMELDEKHALLEKIKSELEILLLPKDENDGKDIIMEIRGAAGGDEANIFAGDLFRMYSRYAEKNNWKIEVSREEEGTSGGFSQIEFLVKGDNVYSKLKFESGVHRVQRVPETETQGRIHTSTATVLVMPEVDDVDVEIKPEDVRVDVYRSSGKGGQGVNTTDSAVRVTHIPTGIVVTCQNERSQIKNKARAMVVLKSRIYDMQQQEKNKAAGSARKSMIGTGDRSEKIRTYNYPQNRVTDHRINFSIMELDRVMDGNIEPIIEALIAEDTRIKMENAE